jgi:hypothetical protein
MAMLAPCLIGAVIGAALAVGFILGNFKLKTNEVWEHEERRHESTSTCLVLVQAENARLRVALAAGAMTEEGKRVAAMIMAALRTVISAESRMLLRALPEPLAAYEAACLPDDCKKSIAPDAEPNDGDHVGKLPVNMTGSANPIQEPA